MAARACDNPEKQISSNLIFTVYQRMAERKQWAPYMKVRFRITAQIFYSFEIRGFRISRLLFQRMTPVIGIFQACVYIRHLEIFSRFMKY